MFDCECSCDCGEMPEISNSKDVKGRKDYECVECKEVILKGAVHEHYTSLFDGKWDSVRTCKRCQTIRNDFGCCYLGNLFAELKDCGWTSEELGF